ncbi:hypothetical protein NBRC10512_001469 [Rhodotorula toruloides]|uniref:Uncharacterized protein n=1 Tax=Rhodotorula toruloides (strain NP11) TaxID=1130832 RepID=M7X407_RHOT1|nr:uncharacterized protein RHTO_06432 [Rhodotorula toruloides NP11]EMS18389.1 hypothetical protein RHTO_06432 [Rhodotorula toruloides NP11]
MSTRPLLTPIDPSSMPARSPSPSSSSSSSSAGSGDDSAPATPSKDKMREWTFPRNGGVASTSSSSTGGARNEVDGIHGRSSSVAPSSAGGHASNGRIQSPSSAKGGEGAASLDLRHRSNASLAFAPSSSLSPPSTTLSLPRLLSSSPSSNSSPNRNPNLAKLVYSNIRRRSAHDLLFILIFGGAFLLFARALAGAGYDATREKSLAVGEGAEVKLPPGFLPHEQGEYLEEVHQRHGDSSHDVGEDLLRDSPEDVHLEEAHAHDADEVYAYPPSDPPADADEDEPLAAADDGPSSPSSSDDGERESEEDGPQIVRLSSTSSDEADDSLEENDLLDTEPHNDAAEDEDEDDSPAISREEAEREDPEALDEDAEVDIEPTFDPPSPSSLDSEPEEPEELTALEELLDSASLEAETGEPSLLELPLEEEEKRVRGLERAGRGREALRAGGGKKGGRGKARGGRRMERRVRR